MPTASLFCLFYFLLISLSGATMDRFNPLRHERIKSFSDATCIAWRVFSRSEWREAARYLRFLADNSGYFGFTFARQPMLRRQRGRILVTQVRGADI